MKDKNGSEIFEGGHGKKPNQKLKPYIVLQYLLKYTDEEHTASSAEIIGYLEECGIYAERRSVYKDIEDINKVIYMLENDCDIAAAEEAVADDEEKTVLYNKSKKGFYVRQRHFELDDIRLLTECVYTAKFITEEKSKKLVDVICQFVSEPQAEKIKYNTILSDRAKTNNKIVLYNIVSINEAMSRSKNHEPEKISFKYLKYTINDMSGQTERRNGNRYVVSPYHIIINDGNYYLLAFDDKSKQIRTYRADRMKDIRSTGEPREGAEAFAAIDVKTYAQRAFSMFGGDTERVTIQFINPLLDTVIDRFGTREASYRKSDNEHFCVTVKAAISEQFFSWVCGFGSKARITEPAHVIDEFKAFTEKIRKMYD